jgi:hypothetical protein
MKNFGVTRGDILVLDRSVTPSDQSLVVVSWADHFEIRQVRVGHDGLILLDDNHAETSGTNGIWGTVTYIVRKVCPDS